MTSSQQEQSSRDEQGIWIGIDLGTSNCACAVWDSTRGSPKWLRLSEIAAPLLSNHNNKTGHTVPSLISLSTSETNHQVDKTILHPKKKQNPLWYRAGYEVVQQQAESSATILSSTKRLLGKKIDDLDQDFISSLSFEVKSSSEREDEILIPVRPYHDGNYLGPELELSPIQVAALLLQSVKEAAHLYLDKNIRKKNLQIPGNGQIQHVVIGVPAQYSRKQTQLVVEAGKLAGFASVHTMLEPTAAAMAYGLAFTASKHSLLVIDIGGGTTDLTICQKNDDNHYQVQVTNGDGQLGGDDIDQLFVRACQDKLNRPQLSQRERQNWKRICKLTKEKLCPPKESDPVPPPDELMEIQLDHDHSVKFTVEEQETIMDPWLMKVRTLIEETISKVDSEIDEVVLVGGMTKLPAVRRCIQFVFPSIELCTSLHPMSSVAQGLAIQAAKLGGIPTHELESALMLDTLPHSMGVSMGEGHYVEILPRNQPLPARGSARFTLASLQQQGVTVPVVEQISESQLEPIGEFTFLLKRLAQKELNTLQHREIQVGLLVGEDGKITVSVFDELDPEQVAKKEFYANNDPQNIGLKEQVQYLSKLALAESDLTADQVVLLILCVGLFLLYLGVKVALNEDPLLDEESAPMQAGEL